MSPYYHDPGFYKPYRPPHFKTVAVALLLLLGLTIAWFALTAPASPPPTAIPPQTTDQANVTEQRIALDDGRIVLCLSFPGQQVSCDWAHAYPGLAE
jgi:hypothetical protein